MSGRERNDLLDVSQLIDLTDKPIGLAPQDISWARVRSNASNCICCCYDNSITLVTNDDSYTLDHVPLDNIRCAQANPSLQHLAISNHSKIAIVNLLDIGSDSNQRPSRANKPISDTKYVNLASHGVTMSDVTFWRWLDDDHLAILTTEVLYTCFVDQPKINHPAFTALSNRSQYLAMEKVCDCHSYFGKLCQITNVHRDASENIYAISGLYSTSQLIKLQSDPNNNILEPTLRHNSSSVPSHLSRLNNSTFEHAGSDSPTAGRNMGHHRSMSASVADDVVCGLVQVYCKNRKRSQLIQAHSVTFTGVPNRIPDFHHQGNSSQGKSNTVMIAAHKTDYQLRVYFTEMATQPSQVPTSQQGSCSTTKFAQRNYSDFPTSITCSQVPVGSVDKCMSVAFITTKYGQLFVCSVNHGSILFHTTMASDIVCSTVLESKSQGVMAICRSGRVLLAKLKASGLCKIMNEGKAIENTKPYDCLDTEPELISTRL